ncbi:MAG: alpha/beta fold hydrolase [Actinomycetes bacterium]
MVDPPEFPEPVLVPSSGGVTVAAYDLGGTGPDVVLVHATGFCAAVWAPMAASMPGCRVVALDVRGHGRSTVPERGMEWSGTADDVLAVVAHFGLDRPVGLGHSMGGAALLLAEQARPGTFAGLWVFEPIVMPEWYVHRGGGDGSNPLAEGARRRRASFASAEEAFANFASKPPLRLLAPEALAAYVTYGFDLQRDGSVTLRCRPEVEAANYEMGARHDGFAHLGEVACPVAVLRGNDEVPGPAGFAEDVADALPAGVLEVHDELFHFGPLEAPADMAASALLLVRSVVGPAED